MLGATKTLTESNLGPIAPTDSLAVHQKRANLPESVQTKNNLELVNGGGKSPPVPNTNPTKLIQGQEEYKREAGEGVLFGGMTKH